MTIMLTRMYLAPFCGATEALSRQSITRCPEPRPASRRTIRRTHCGASEALPAPGSLVGGASHPGRSDGGSRGKPDYVLEQNVGDRRTLVPLELKPTGAPSACTRAMLSRSEHTCFYFARSTGTAPRALDAQALRPLDIWRRAIHVCQTETGGNQQSPERAASSTERRVPPT